MADGVLKRSTTALFGHLSCFFAASESGKLERVKNRAKILLIRFSSFGDVTQCLSVATRLSEMGEVHWAIRTDLAPLLSGHPHLHKVWPLERREGFRGLLKLIRQLRQEKFTHIYDAHNSLRSRLICWALGPLFNPSLSRPAKVLRKSQKRWKRFLLFRFRLNTYEKPFSGQRDLLEPLRRWGLSTELPPPPQIFPAPADFAIVDRELSKHGFDDFVALCPSAAYELKRWPAEHWRRLIELCPGQKFALLGGLHDAFVADFVSLGPDRIVNFAGRLSLMESAALIARARLTVANDTGLLHVAEQLGRPAIALMGPAPFGFPSRSSTKILERDLKCRPCSKHGQGPCINPKFHQCLVDIRPEEVAALVKKGRPA
jgi:ADP-heptose:LPS heptosyltransferase